MKQQANTGYLKYQRAIQPWARCSLPAWRNHGTMSVTLTTRHCNPSFTCFSSLWIINIMRARAMSVLFTQTPATHTTPRKGLDRFLEGINGWQGKANFQFCFPLWLLTEQNGTLHVFSYSLPHSLPFLSLSLSLKLRTKENCWSFLSSVEDYWRPKQEP